MSDQGLGEASAPEEWRDVPGMPDCQASSFGRVRNERGRILRAVNSYGYPVLQRRQNGESLTIFLHAMVAAAFIGPRPDGLQIDHINRVKHDNRPSNLRYVTHAENQANRVLPPQAGELHNGAKLTEQQVREILASPRPSARGPSGQRHPYSAISLAARYGVSRTAIMNIFTGKRWGHLRVEQSDVK